MEVRTVYTLNDKAPVSGNALYIVVEERDRHVTLLHPVTLTKFDIPLDDYKSGAGPTLWPINQTKTKFDREKIGHLLQLTAKDFSRRQKQYPAQLVRRLVAEFLGLEVEKVPLYKEPSATAKGPRQKTAKRPGVIDAIVEMLHKGATIDEMVAGLKEQFPDRNADGMRTTVRCQINRLPAKLGLKIDRKDTKNGQVFKFVTN